MPHQVVHFVEQRGSICFTRWSNLSNKDDLCDDGGNSSMVCLRFAKKNAPVTPGVEQRGSVCRTTWSNLLNKDVQFAAPGGPFCRAEGFNLPHQAVNLSNKEVQFAAPDGPICQAKGINLPRHVV